MRGIIVPAMILYMVALTGRCEAYIGPGVGAGVVGVVLGFLASIFLAIFAIVWYPLKRIFKSKKKRTPEEKNDNK